MKRQINVLSVFAALMVWPLATGFAQALPKAAVAERIKQVEDGVDKFRDYLEKRGENAKDTASSSTRKNRRTATESQKSTANAKKDELNDALGDLNRSTNRLRRKFDATDKWIETKSEVERVVDDGRKINQVIARGKYGTEVSRLWATLRSGINDLARAYGVTPLGV